MQMKQNPVFGYNQKYLTKDGKPWFPVMGEFHYSRFPQEDWEESLYKMKMGGVDIVSTYAIWIHHEEVRGEYEFGGVRDLRKFITLCAKTGLYLCLRIGPWCHGEVRNGGLPDWMLHQHFQPRTNAPAYFEEVRKFYSKLYGQAQGLFLRDGGPIIAIQVENEYGHCGGLTGEDGENHMRLLTNMAKEIGFDAPIWTATGWGGAVTGGLLPVMGGYCEAPWDQRLTEIEPSANYLFSYERNDHNIGSDLGLGTGITFDMEKFPYLTAELGGGLQVTHHRRPVARAEDIGAMSLVKLGSGVNLLGYYMYHGGTNPKGKLTTLQETRATGYLNDLPELNYDFRAPIREYGQISETYKELKLLAMFLHDFGSELCEMPAYIPEDNPEKVSDTEHLRISYRHNGAGGYVFVNNYQRRCRMAKHDGVALGVSLKHETLNFPKITVEDGNYFFFPFNMKLGNATLKTATATPLCKLENVQETAYVFYTDGKANYVIDGALDGVKIITLSKADAKNAWKVHGKKEHLVISASAVVEEHPGVLHISGDSAIRLKVYPPFEKAPKGFVQKENDHDFAVYEKQVPQLAGSVKAALQEESKEKKVYVFDITAPDGAHEWFLNIQYSGDSARAFLNDQLCADHFYSGEPWQIGLKRFGYPNSLIIEIDALQENATVFLEQWPEMQAGTACCLNDVTIQPVYQTITEII